VPLHSPTIRAPRRPRLTRAAAIATACIAAGAATVVITNDNPAPQNHTIAAPSQTAVTRHFDSEANKIASMRALRRRIAKQQANSTVTQSAARAQERYYSSYGEPTDTDTAAARAQERYYSSYREPQPFDVGATAARAREHYYSGAGALLLLLRRTRTADAAAARAQER
jgi:hypothetical protein